MFFWKNLSEGQDGGREAAADDSEDGSRARFVARAYNVFNAEQVDGYEAPAVPELSDEERIAKAEAFFAAIPARISERAARLATSRARIGWRWCRSADSGEAKGYYSVLAHELTHWSGAKAIGLDRDLSGRFGSESYAIEELVAELGRGFHRGAARLAERAENGSRALRCLMAEGAEERLPGHLPRLPARHRQRRIFWRGLAFRMTS